MRSRFRSQVTRKTAGVGVQYALTAIVSMSECADAGPGYDEYHPVSHSGKFMVPKGMGWIIVDALDTMMIGSQLIRMSVRHKHIHHWHRSHAHPARHGRRQTRLARLPKASPHGPRHHPHRHLDRQRHRHPPRPHGRPQRADHPQRHDRQGRQHHPHGDGHLVPDRDRRHRRRDRHLDGQGQPGRRARGLAAHSARGSTESPCDEGRASACHFRLGHGGGDAICRCGGHVSLQWMLAHARVSRLRRLCPQ